jgi:hypothetical protein
MDAHSDRDERPEDLIVMPEILRRRYSSPIRGKKGRALGGASRNDAGDKNRKMPSPSCGPRDPWESPGRQHEALN